VTEAAGLILLVDDEQLNRDMLSRRLARCGFEVVLAAGGREALDLARSRPFDLILLDQMMPEISGSEVLRALRKDYSAEALPIVMVTAVAESDKIAEALESGANDYITKPIDFKVALARIRFQLTRKRAEDARRQSEERYAMAEQATRDGLWDWNLITGEVYFSPRWRQMVGLSESAAADNVQTWFSRILGRDREALLAAVQLHLSGQADTLQCSYRMLDTSGGLRWMLCRGIVSRDAQGRPVRLAGSQSDVTEEKTRDALTGLTNRLGLLGALDCALTSSPRGYDHPADCAILLLALEPFKEINERLGHLGGNALLKGAAGRLKLFCDGFAATRAAQPSVSLFVAHTGAEEFAVLVQGVATADVVRELAAGLQAAISVPLDLSGHLVHCTLHIGAALSSGLHTVPEDLLRDADIALYIAGQRGKGEIVLFSPEMRQAASDQIDLQHDIRLAVERGELEVVYQPKVNLASGQTYGVEALLRWNHSTRGRLEPDTFIAIAEETGAILEIGRWVRQEACRQAKQWHDQFEMDPPLELSVNLSPREFKQEGLVEQIAHTLEQTRFPASCLHLEITENVLLEDLPSARQTLEDLKKLGLLLDIDDFGSGYSSLKYLQELPFDLLKVDRYFTQSLDPTDASSGALIQSILSMANDLGLKVVAEGVETLHHSRRLQELGCSLGQGYYFSKPIDSTEMQAFLETEHAVESRSFELPEDAPAWPG
jgi:diguanylate cyclase (GGDEF)-like protein